MTARLPQSPQNGPLPFVIENYKAILARLKDTAEGAARNAAEITLTAVTKRFDADHIIPILERGHRVFGENKVQEAARKWPPLKKLYPDTQLRLIGPLQTNKTREAVALFDVIETLDREKLARSLADEMAKSAKRPVCYIQVNIGEEPQKAGIPPREAADFITLCRKTYHLPIKGVMCLPPVDEYPAPYFALLEKIAHDNGVEAISMGMSDDFEMAVELGATHIRIGSGIFGPRPA